MLKTFTVLVTASAELSADVIESAILHGMTAVADGEMRIDAQDGDLLWALPDGHTAHNVREEHRALREQPKPRTWADLSRDAQTIILNRASGHGGGFVSRLADAWMRADSANAAKLGEAFGAMLLETYGDA